MSVALETFVKQLEDSGIVAAGKLESFVPPKAHPKDAEELARELIKQNVLTKFQAQHVLENNARALFLGNYTLLDTVGAGGMGHVFKAEHRRMERVVAIKMLPAALMKDAAAVARFQREVKAAAKLLHSNIIAAHDADEAGGVHFLVMEYVEGSDLSALVKKDGPFSVAKAVGYILQAAKGLEFAHGEGVVHRDIKPANLLLDKKGVVKILDMGLARIDAGGDVAAQAELTGSGTIMGTVDYMAPEQALSTKNADARADIYSLGCSLYYLIAGKATYDGETLMAKLMAHSGQPIPSLKEAQALVPAELEAVFRKMVAKSVADRYQTMSEVVADLEKCQAALLGATATAATSAWPTPRTLKSLPQPSADPLIDPQRKPKLSRPAWAGIVAAALLALGISAVVIFKMQPTEGTLVLTIDQPGATVQVFDQQGKVEINRQGEQGTISIPIDSGKHRLKVEKDGFADFAKEFDVAAGGTTEITAALKADKKVPSPVSLLGLPGMPGRIMGDFLEPLKHMPTAGIKNPSATVNDPAFQRWMKDTQAMPAEKQIDAVAKKLMELNPAFDGRETHAIEGGVVTELAFLTANVTDISPVRALAGLKILDCSEFGSNEIGTSNGILSDLSPLKGLELVELNCSRTQVSDLRPLQGMPLLRLDCNGTRVSDLSPLAPLALTRLGCNQTRVSDLSPLMKIPTLRTLSVEYTKVTSAGVAALQKALPNCKIEWDGTPPAGTGAKPKTPEPAAAGSK